MDKHSRQGSQTDGEGERTKSDKKTREKRQHTIGDGQPREGSHGKQRLELHSEGQAENSGYEKEQK